MIVRMWHGRVPASKAPAYRRFLRDRAVPDYRSTAGNLDVYLLEFEPRVTQYEVVGEAHA